MLNRLLKLSQYMRWIAACLLAAGIAIPTESRAAVATKLVNETMEILAQKFGRELAEFGAETFTKKLEAAAAKYGDDVFDAARKVGPRALYLADNAGSQAAKALKLMSKYGDNALLIVNHPQRLKLVAGLGDDAAEAIIKHGEAAEPLLRQFAGDGATAMSKLSATQGRELAIMAGEGSLAKIPQSAQVLRVIGKYGDKGMEFVWKHKAALAVAATCAAFVANPEPFIDGAKDLAAVVAENAIKPLASVPGAMAEGAAKNTEWTIVIIVGLTLLTGYAAWRFWLKQRLATKAR